MKIDSYVGNVVNMKVSNEKHYGNDIKVVRNKDDISGSFSDVFMNAIEKVNDLQTNSNHLAEKMVYEPESVDIHQVMIAAQKAELSLTFTKSVRDEAIKAYRDLMNLR